MSPHRLLWNPITGCRERSRGRRATEKRYEIAASSLDDLVGAAG
jgi:hypothetical protein